MLRFNVMDIHERPSMAMTLSAGQTKVLYLINAIFPFVL